MRWSLRMAEFDFDVEHRPGNKIRHVDALSRHVQAITTEQSLSKNLVRAEQKRDKFCSTLQFGKLKGKSARINFCAINGLVSQADHNVFAPTF